MAKESELFRKFLSSLIKDVGGQARAAEMLGISQPALSAYVTGQREPNLKSLGAFAEKLGTDVSAMISNRAPPAIIVKPTPESALDILRTTICGPDLPRPESHAVRAPQSRSTHAPGPGTAPASLGPEEQRLRAIGKIASFLPALNQTQLGGILDLIEGYRDAAGVIEQSPDLGKKREK